MDHDPFASPPARSPADLSSDPSPGADHYIAYARTGDALALERALLACADRASTQARRMLGNAADADDAVQEAFLQLARGGRRYDQRVPFAAWVGRLVRTACLRVRRSDRRRRRREEEAMQLIHHRNAGPAHVDQRLDGMEDALRRLGEADRAVIDLHYFAGLSQADTAAALGSSENAVALRLSRARNRLRRILGARGMALSASAIAGLLAAQPACAASPGVIASAHALAGAVASGAAMPATTVVLSPLQKGLFVMSTYPLATAVAGTLAAILLIVPVALWPGDAVPGPRVVPPPAVERTATDPPSVAHQPAANAPWQGPARELLPFIDPQATYSGAADWNHLLRVGASTKPTSLLADPRVAKVVAHIREQLRLWVATGADVPDFGAWLANGRGIVGNVRWPVDPTANGQVPMNFVAEIDASESQHVLWLYTRTARISGYRPVTIGPFTGIGAQGGQDPAFIGVSGSRLTIGQQSLLSAALPRMAGARPEQTVAPAVAPAWARIDLRPLVAYAAALDSEGTDPLGFVSWFGAQWRTASPVITVGIDAVGDVWRTTIDARGFDHPALRAPSATISDTVPADALASVVVGFHPERMARFLPSLIDAAFGVRERGQVLALLGRMGFGLGAWPSLITGDVALIAQSQAP